MKQSSRPGEYLPILVLTTIIGLNLALYLALFAVQAFFTNQTELILHFLGASLFMGLIAAALGFLQNAIPVPMRRRTARRTYRFGMFLSLLFMLSSCALILVIDPGSIQVAFLSVVTGGFVFIGVYIKLRNYAHVF